MMQITQHKTPSATREARLRFALQVAEQAQRVGDRIAEERERNGWSRPEMARKLPGVTSGNDVYRWEKGKHLPRSDMLEAIAGLFGITVADLYAGPVADQDGPGDLMAALNGVSRATALEEAVADLSNQIEALKTELLSELGQVRSALEDRPQRTVRGGRSPAKKRS